MHRFNLEPNDMEKINPSQYQPGWKPAHTVHITTNKKKAINDATMDNPDLKIFTDRSVLDGNIGASTVLYRNNRHKASLRYKLGQSIHHTVYEGEACGTLLMTKLILNKININSNHLH